MAQERRRLGQGLPLVRDAHSNTGRRTKTLRRSSGTTAQPPQTIVQQPFKLPAATDNRVIFTRRPEKDKGRKEALPRHEWHHLHDAEVIVEKQRETGWEGTYKLTYAPRMYPFSPWEEKETEAAKKTDSNTPKSAAGEKKDETRKKNQPMKNVPQSPQFPLGVG